MSGNSTYCCRCGQFTSIKIHPDICGRISFEEITSCPALGYAMEYVSAYHRISSGFSHWEMNPSVSKNRFKTFVKPTSDNNLNFQQSWDHVGPFLALKWVKMIIMTEFVKALSMENCSSELQEGFTSNLLVKRWLPLIKVLNYLQTQKHSLPGQMDVHVSFCVSSPGQGSPLTGVGLLHARCRRCTPRPHDAEQSVHWLHVDQPPFTARRQIWP